MLILEVVMLDGECIMLLGNICLGVVFDFGEKVDVVLLLGV